MSSNFQALQRAVISASVSNTWSTAVTEWEITGLEEDPSMQNFCICGQPELVKLFTITNTHSGLILYPIGSKCVKLFGREDLEEQVDQLTAVFRLHAAIRAGKNIALTSDFFTKSVLDYLYDAGAFTPDQWNSGNGENDYDFLLKMFRKRKKEDITASQRAKIYMLLTHKVVPFVQSDPRLK